MSDLCATAKRGQVCIDDLCYSAKYCGGLTLCGFDPCEYDCMEREYDDDCEYIEEDRDE